MLKSPLDKISVLSNGDIAVGKCVFKTTHSYIGKYSRNDFYARILKANGYFSFSDTCPFDEKPGDVFGHLKGFDVYLGLNGGEFHVDNYDMPEIANKYHCELFGSRFDKRFLKVCYKTWLAPFEDHLCDLGLVRFIGKGRFFGNSAPHVYMLRHAGEHIRQLIADDLIHLAPFVLLFGRAPADIKNILGKGLWKNLAGNSKSRNKSILSIILRGVLDERPAGYDSELFILDEIRSGAHNNSLIQLLNTLSGISTSYFSNFSYSTDVSFASGANISDLFNFNKNVWACEVARKERNLSPKKVPNVMFGGVSRHNFVSDYQSLYTDTLNMSRALNLPFSNAWSLSRMQREHDDYSKLFLARQHSDEVFSHASKVPCKLDVKVDGDLGTAEFIDNPLAVAQLARSHRNCLGSYVRDLFKPHWLLYRFYIGNKETACMFFNKGNGWSVHQHHAPCNQPIDAGFKVIEKAVIDNLKSIKVTADLGAVRNYRLPDLPPDGIEIPF